MPQRQHFRTPPHFYFFWKRDQYSVVAAAKFELMGGNEKNMATGTELCVVCTVFAGNIIAGNINVCKSKMLVLDCWRKMKTHALNVA